MDFNMGIILAWSSQEVCDKSGAKNPPLAAPRNHSFFVASVTFLTYKSPFFIFSGALQGWKREVKCE